MPSAQSVTAISIHRASEYRKKSVIKCQRMKARSARKRASRWPSSTFMPTRGASEDQRVREQARTRLPGQSQDPKAHPLPFPTPGSLAQDLCRKLNHSFPLSHSAASPQLLVSRVNAWKASPGREDHIHLMSYIFKFLGDENKQTNI